MTTDRFAALRKYVADCEAAGLVDVNGDIVTLRALLNAADERDSVRATFYDLLANDRLTIDALRAERDRLAAALRDLLAAIEAEAQAAIASANAQENFADPGPELAHHLDVLNRAHDAYKAARAALAGMKELTWIEPRPLKP